MARDATTGDPGSIEAAPYQPSRSLSRYRTRDRTRTLEGKDTSSLRGFHVFQDSHCGHGSDDDSADLRQDATQSKPILPIVPILRLSRSRSVRSLRHAPKRPELKLTEARAVPGAQRKRGFLESFKTPPEFLGQAPWISRTGVDKSQSTKTNRDEATRCHMRDSSHSNHLRNLRGSGGREAGPTMALAYEQVQVPYEPHHHAPKYESLPSSVRLHREVYARGQLASGSEARSSEPEPSSGPSPDAELVVQKQMPHSIPSHAAETHTPAQKHQHLTDDLALLEAEAETPRLPLELRKLELVTPAKQKPVVLQTLSRSSSGVKRTTVNARISQSNTANASSTIASSVIHAPSLRSHFSCSRGSTLSSGPRKMSFIEPGGKGIVPQTDAPISASNGGERRVVVRCLSSTINLPVTADTSPMDILNAAAEMTRHNLTPTTCVLIECYSCLGLERRLRLYERIRDVMNSWDRDQQNSLLIVPCDTPPNDDGLAIESVPRTDEPPCGFSMQMHHSSKPGKWKKRWVTLLDNGQMYVAKSINTQPYDKDCSILCHLTDFDIYTPKESEMRRKLRPPKRFCYAIKSLEKTVVFSSTEKFVHFFSTEDAQQAASFFEKVHGWRSWYMVNRMVDLGGEKSKPSPQQPLLDTGINYSNRSPSMRNNVSSVKSNSIGRNGHLVSDRGYSRTDEASSETLKDTHDVRLSIKTNPGPTQLHKALSVRSKVSSGAKNSSLSRDIPPTVREEEPEFSVGGLLGDSYEQKRKQSEAATPAFTSSEKFADGPFTDAPSLLNGGITKPGSDASTRHATKQAEKDERKDEPKSWFPSAAEHSARTRHTHQREQQQQRQQRQHQQHHQPQRRPMPTDRRASFSPSTSAVVGSSSSSISSCMPRRDRYPPPLLDFNNDISEQPRFYTGPNAGARHMRTPSQPLIHHAAGGVISRGDAAAVALRRHSSRRSGSIGLVGAMHHHHHHPPPFPPPPPPPPPLSQPGHHPAAAEGPQRHQSRVSRGTGTLQPSLRHFSHGTHNKFGQDVPLRRLYHGEGGSGEGGRVPAEPLVNRAR
ncbi:hypothetical protein E4U19_004904 [Claviceps sp. Clav32 group G5]|nr:hypothetical protein E4U19_004904 [Claviceps sp. Clav32 group G5]KAG6052228.1 hypothetical protein E4U39_002265 [Claviceps sp. Clav50 group G5]